MAYSPCQKNLPSDCASVGPVNQTRVLNMHRQIRFVKTPTPIAPLAKEYDFQRSLAICTISVRVLSSSVDWYDRFWSTACCMSLAVYVASRNAQWREVRLLLITGTPNDLMLQNNCYKGQIDSTSKSLKLQKG